ncbi:MAG: MBL fold metallo-hydrolase, partial [Actinomycetota bacterium]|nr:MBL fold metallo-hydrolase [Actinomycetota bacterium]
LYGPPGSSQVFRKVASLFGIQNLVEDAFDVHEYDPGSTVEAGEISIDFREVPHFIETFAIGLTGSGGSRITYGADCRPNEDLVEFGRDTDLLITEATLPRPERTGIRGHLTPGEAGEHARDARARRLLLTHISDELDPAWALSEAKAHFGGPAEVAVEGLEIDV